MITDRLTLVRTRDSSSQEPTLEYNTATGCTYLYCEVPYEVLMYSPFELVLYAWIRLLQHALSRVAVNDSIWTLRNSKRSKSRVKA